MNKIDVRLEYQRQTGTTPIKAARNWQRDELYYEYQRWLEEKVCNFETRKEDSEKIISELQLDIEDENNEKVISELQLDIEDLKDEIKYLQEQLNE